MNDDELQRRLQSFGAAERRLTGRAPAGLSKARAGRRWSPLAAAAVTALLVGGTFIVIDPGQNTDPAAPSTPSPSISPSPGSSRSPEPTSDPGLEVSLIGVHAGGLAVVSAGSRTSGRRRLFVGRGEAWDDRTPRDLPAGQYIVDFASNGSVWWLISQDCAGSDGVQVRRSLNSGDSWELTGFRRGISCSAGSVANLHRVERDSAVLTVVQASAGSGELYTTSDGGTNWSEPAAMPHAAHPTFLDDDTAVVAGFHQPGFYRTTDRGQSWSPTPMLINKCATAAASSWAPGSAVTATTTTDAVTLRRTADGGRIWDQRPTQHFRLGGNCASLRLFAINGATWWAQGHLPSSPLISRTTDGGGTWKEVLPPGGRIEHPGGVLLQLLPTGASTAMFTLERDGRQRTFHTTDAGQSWQDVTESLGGAAAPDRTASRRCRGRDLSAVRQPQDGVGGHGFSFIDLGNTSDTPCRLEGYPTRITSRGRAVTFTALDRGSAFLPTMIVSPVVLWPGENGRLGLSANFCNDRPNDQTLRLPDLVVTIGGDPVTVMDDGIDPLAACGGSLGVGTLGASPRR